MLFEFNLAFKSAENDGVESVEIYVVDATNSYEAQVLIHGYMSKAGISLSEYRIRSFFKVEK